MLPAETAVKLPGGGEDWPKMLSPQQAAVPSVRSPQLWRPPAETAVKVPAGGEDWPKLLSPQQASVPSVLTPQPWRAPASSAPDTAPGGAVAIDRSASPAGGAAAQEAGTSTTSRQPTTSVTTMERVRTSPSPEAHPTCAAVHPQAPLLAAAEALEVCVSVPDRPRADTRRRRVADL